MKKHLLTTLLSVFLSMFAFAQTQVDLPITFDDVNTNYNLADFGGNVSAIVADPVNAANNVCQAEKTNTAQLWAGTTIGGSGLASPIPFAANANKISVRVYSPDAGIIVKLKAEDPNDPTKSVEANLVTTTSNAWETLEFDFTVQALGTAPINYSYNYQKLSIFFNFGIDGATAGAKTYYCDDIIFMPATVPTIAPITFQVQNPDSTPVWVFGSWSGWSNYPGDAMTPIGNNTWEITLNLPVNSNFEYLFVNGTTPIKEALNPAAACTNGNAQYTNRTLVVGTTAATYCAQWATCNSCNTTPTTAAITFQVQNPDSTPVWVFGSWSGWSNYPGDAMTPIGNNTWEITLNLPVNSNFEYLYVNGTTPIKEALNPADPCTNGNAQYTNRTLAVGTTAATYCAQWATCNPCSSGPAQVNVTFQVQNPDSTPVFVFGSWSGWSNYPGDLMTPIGNGVYSITLPLNANSNYEYLFVNGGTPVKEVLDPAWPCTNGNAQYTNRTLAVAAADLTVCAEWATCNSCTSVPALANVTFQVENPDSVPVYVFGSWNGWSNYPGTPMTSIGNGIYEATIQLGTNANYEYLFVNGTTPAKEVLNPAWPCTNGNGQYTNRTLAFGAADTTVCSIWATCSACGTVAPVYINATFQVQSPDSTPVYVFGSWSGWANWPGTAMTSIGNNTYEATIQLLENTNYEYLFVNGGTPIKEVLDPAWLCTNGNSQYTNRVINTPSVDVTTCAKWASCDPCSPTSINEISSADLQLVYANQGLMISSTKVKSVDQLVIFDVLGKQVFAAKSNVNTNALLPVQFDATGVYLVKLMVNNQVMTFKVFAGN